MLAILSILPRVTLATVAGTGFLFTGVLLLNFLFWVWRFRSEPSILALDELRAKVNELTSQLNKKKRAIRAIEQEKQDVLSSFNYQTQKLERQLKECERKEKEAVDGLQKSLVSALAGVRQRRKQADMQEQAEIQRLQHAGAGKILAINRTIGTMTTAEADELKSTLQQLQTDHINCVLRQASLDPRSITGIGPGLTSKLISAGIRTAADVSMSRVKRVNGFGQARASAVVAWRNWLEARAKATMPQALPPQEQARIRSQYALQRSNLQASIQLEERRLAREEAVIRDKFKALKADLDREELDANANNVAHHHQIRASHKQQADSIKAGLARLKADTAVEVRNVDARMSQASPELSKLNYERGRLKRELENATQIIRFSTYLKRIIFLTV